MGLQPLGYAFSSAPNEAHAKAKIRSHKNKSENRGVYFTPQLVAA